MAIRTLGYLGAYEPTSPTSYSGLREFGATVGRSPNIALYYSGWWEPFETAFAKDAFAAGAIPAVQIDPNDPHNPVTLAEIADGKYDSYLENYADQVAGYGHPVIIGFAHEPNGDWYKWGQKYASPATWVAAWRHIVNVFRKQGADNVTWLWTMNVMVDQTPPISAYWPGASYVTWVGIDGYYIHPQNSYAQVFGPTIVAIREITSDPILISETAIRSVQVAPSQITNLYAGIRAFGNLGLIWFDVNMPGEPYRLEGDSDAIAVFRQLTRPLRLEYGR